jgi:hypothetical protein
LADLDEQQLTDLIDQEAGYEPTEPDDPRRPRSQRGSVIELAEAYKGRVLELTARYGGSTRLAESLTDNPIVSRQDQAAASDEIPSSSRRLQPHAFPPVPSTLSSQP